jgi:hypothetical protein
MKEEFFRSYLQWHPHRHVPVNLWDVGSNLTAWCRIVLEKLFIFWTNSFMLWIIKICMLLISSRMLDCSVYFVLLTTQNFSRIICRCFQSLLLDCFHLREYALFISLSRILSNPGKNREWFCQLFISLLLNVTVLKAWHLLGKFSHRLFDPKVKSVL